MVSSLRPLWRALLWKFSHMSHHENTSVFLLGVYQRWCWLFNVSGLIILCASVPEKQGMWLDRYACVQTPKHKNRSWNLFSPTWKKIFLPTTNFWAPALFQPSKDAVLIALVYFMILMRSPHCCNGFSKHDISWLHSENRVVHQRQLKKIAIHDFLLSSLHPWG